MALAESATIADGYLRFVENVARMRQGTDDKFPISSFVLKDETALACLMDIIGQELDNFREKSPPKDYQVLVSLLGFEGRPRRLISRVYADFDLSVEEIHQIRQEFLSVFAQDKNYPRISPFVRYVSIGPRWNNPEAPWSPYY